MYYQILSLNRRYSAAGMLFASMLLLCVTTSQAAVILSLEQAVSEVVTANPGLSAIQARAMALAEIPEQESVLPDPVLTLNIVNLPVDSYSFSQESMTQFQVGITQVLPYPGKLALRSQAARQESDAAAEEVKEKQLQLIREVKIVWWNLFYLDRALEVIAQNQRLLEQIVNVAETRYTVGQGLQQDILLAQLEVSRLRDNAIRTRSMREKEVARLNALLNYHSSTIIQIPVKTDENLPRILNQEALQHRVMASRPILAALQERISAARSRVELAKKNYAPDFKVSAVYGLRNGENPDGRGRSDLGSVFFSMNLPVFTKGKQDHAVDQHNSELAQQKYQLHEQRNQIAAEVQQAITDYIQSREQAMLFRQEIVPLARQTVEAMLASYQVGKAEFVSLIRSQTTLYNYETEYWKVLSAANQALVRLVAAVGEEKIYE